MSKLFEVKFPKTLLFINGMTPNEEDIALAKQVGPGVVFRNAEYVPAKPNPGQIEKADFVAGAVPPAYKHLPMWAGDKPAAPAAEPAPAAPAAPVVVNNIVHTEPAAGVPAAPVVPPAPPASQPAPEGWGAVPPAPPAA